MSSEICVDVWSLIISYCTKGSICALSFISHKLRSLCIPQLRLHEGIIMVQRIKLKRGCPVSYWGQIPKFTFIEGYYYSISFLVKKRNNYNTLKRIDTDNEEYELSITTGEGFYGGSYI